MSGFFSNVHPWLLAATERTTDPVTEFDLPEEGWQWAVYGGGFLLVIALSIAVYLRDAAGLNPFWRFWMASLRVAVIAALLVIALNPHERTSQESISPSRVVVMVDTSTSMDLPNRLPGVGDSPGERGELRTRAEAARELLANTDLLETLQKNHEVLVYTFGETLSERVRTYPRLGEDGAVDPEAEAEADAEGDVDEEGDPDASGSEDDAAADEGEGESATDGSERPADFDWAEALQPQGLETRLGDALRDVVREYAGRSFSGVVVVSDGGNNAGNDPDLARRLATKQNVRVVSVGVGDTDKQSNLRITNVQMPTEVHVNDPYELKAYVQGQNLGASRVRVELLARPEEDANLEPELVEEKEIDLPADGAEQEVAFTRTNTVAGEIEYVVRVRPVRNTRELRDDDNVRSQVVEVSDRKTRVLIVAGGPMRDYRFVRNALTRHGGIDLTVWLQTVEPENVSAVSQESDNPLLTEFPRDRATLFDFDVIVAFDPDWSRLTVEDRENLQEWVSREAGGLIVVAGDVHTPELVGADETFDGLREMYPVVLDPYMLDVQFDLGDANPDEIQPWAPEFTRDGENVEFLRLSDESAEITDAWDEFEGFYRTYPTNGVKGGTVVYAYFSNPKARNVLLAGHYYQAGRVLYLGSPEMWRLRAVGEEYYDRFWTKAIREVGQSRMRRGGNRSMLMPERDEYLLGETVIVRARVLNAQYEPVEAESLEMDVIDPLGKPLIPRRTLRPVSNQPGVFQGDFRATVASEENPYIVQLKVPGTDEQVEEKVSVRIPRLETDRSEQNRALLSELSRERDRDFYVSLSEQSSDKVASAVPSMLPDRTEPIVVDERRNSLWDKRWVLYLLVGLLSVEWLTRKLLKLA